MKSADRRRWLGCPRQIVGLVLFLVAMVMTIGRADAREIRSPGFDLQVDDATGWPTAMASLQPNRLDLLETTTPFVLSVQNLSKGAVVDLSRATFAGRGDDGITYALEPSGADWQGKLSGRITYHAVGDTLRISAEVRVLQDLPGEHLVKFAFGLKPELFQREWFPSIPHDIMLAPRGRGYEADYPWLCPVQVLSEKPGEKRLYVGGLPKGDAVKQSDVPWSSGLTVPIGVAERADRLLAFATFDTGWPVLFATDSAGARGTFPAILRFPKRLRKGDVFSFALNFRSFVRPENNYTQVMGWYLDHAYSTNPSTAEAVGRKTDRIGRRTMTGGLNCWGPTGYGRPADYVHPTERQMVQDGMNQTWWISAHSEIDENYPVDDRVFFDECQRPTTAAKLKAEIQRQMKLGIGVFMYRRNWLIWENCRDDRPPYRTWYLDYEKPIEERAIETKVLNPEASKAAGVGKLHKVMGDMNVPAFQNWATEKMMAELAFYQPSGQWWDMGDSGQGGTIAVMKRVRDKAAELYPAMRFIGNEKYAGMDGLHCDALVIEGFEMGGKSERVFQCAKAYGRPVFNLVYSPYCQSLHMWTSKCNYYSGIVAANEVRYFALRYRTSSLPSRPNLPIVSIKQTNWRDGPKIPLVMAKDILADGRWHTFTVPLAGRLQGIPELATVAIGHTDKLLAKADKAYITSLFIDLPGSATSDIRFDIDRFGFYADKPPENQLTPPRAAEGNELAFDDMNRLTNWPDVQPLLVEPGVATFVVRKGEEGGTWMKADFSMFHRALMRGLALGAFPGLGPGEPRLTLLRPLWDFTLTGVNLVPVAEPLIVRSADETAIVASGWVGQAEFQAAAYNLTRKPAMCRMTLDLAALRSKYGFTGRLVSDQLTVFNAVTGARPATDVKWTRSDDRTVGLTCELGPNELLLMKAH